MTSTETGPYRTGGHWGVTIVREGTQPPDATGHRPDARLVAVVTDGDKGLAQVIVGLLNHASGVVTSSSPRPAPGPAGKVPVMVCTCGIGVTEWTNGLHHITARGFIDAAADKRHEPKPVPTADREPRGRLADPDSSLYASLHHALQTALEGEDYGVAGKVCELLEQVTRQVNREYRRQQRSSRAAR